MDPLSELYQENSSISDMYVRNRPNIVNARTRSAAFMSSLRSAMGEVSDEETLEELPFRYLTPVTTNDKLLSSLVDQAVNQNILTSAEAADMKTMLSSHIESRNSSLFEVLRQYMEPYEDITGRTASAANLPGDLQAIEKDKLDVFKQSVILAQRAGELSPDLLRQAQELIADNEKFIEMLRRMKTGQPA